MRKSQALAFLAFLLAAACSSFGQGHHRGVSARQEFLLCAQKVPGKTVLWQGILDGRLDASNAPTVDCPMGRRVYCGTPEK